MIRRLVAAALAIALLPASAEAAKLRFSSGSRSHNPHADQSQRDGSHVAVTPSLRSRQAESATANQPSRTAAPTAVSATETAELRGTQPAEPQIWCRSQTVVGGFCILN
ncbi:hypothetical protein [Bosea sp. Root483D1]|uniref:hypothetical protein n=1 Tax=Bosea sp. Root483D1 TaxID=1736544 RepID=UPI000AD78106|nr:hypothetical protein [Bosea sp. Root483D1]